MAQQIINNGESGLIVRGKLNDNFTELYTGKDSVTVANFAALPPPATVPGQRYWCLASQGVYLINRKPAGAYYSDGVAWTWLGDNPTTADQIGFVPAAGIAATNVQAAIEEAVTDQSAINSTLVPQTRTVGTTAPLGGGGDLSAALNLSISAATSSADGSMSAADKAKLDNITYQVLTADVTNSTTGVVPTGLSFTPLSSSTYIIEAFLTVTSTALTNGVQVGISLPFTVAIASSSVHIIVPSSTSAGTVERLGQLTPGAVIFAAGTAIPSITTYFPVSIRAVVRTNTSSTGDITIVFNSELASPNSVTVYAGSTMRLTKVA
jgi:hypothetical protein